MKIFKQMKKTKLIAAGIVLFLTSLNVKAQYPDTLIIKLDDYGLIKFMSHNIIKRGHFYKEADLIYAQFYSEIVNSDYKFDKEDIEINYYGGDEISQMTISDKESEKEKIYTDSTNSEYIYNYPYKINFPHNFGSAEKMSIYLSKIQDLKTVLDIDIYELLQQAVKNTEKAGLKKRTAVTGIFNSNNNVLTDKKILKEGKLFDYLILSPSVGIVAPDDKFATSMAANLELSFIKKTKSNFRSFGLSYQLIFTPLSTAVNGSANYNVYNPVFVYYRFSKNQYGMSFGAGVDLNKSEIWPYMMIEVRRKNIGVRMSSLTNKNYKIYNTETGMGGFTLGLNYYF